MSNHAIIFSANRVCTIIFLVLLKNIMGSGQAVRRLPLEQEIEGSNPSSPANMLMFKRLERVFF